MARGRGILSALGEALRVYAGASASEKQYNQERSDRLSAAKQAHEDLLSGRTFTAGENALNRSQQSALAASADSSADSRLARQLQHDSDLQAEKIKADKTLSESERAFQLKLNESRLANDLLIASMNNDTKLGQKATLSFDDKQQLAGDFKQSKIKSFLSRAAAELAGTGDQFAGDVEDKVINPSDPISLRSALTRDDYKSAAPRVSPLLDSLDVAQGTPAMNLAEMWNYFAKPEQPKQPRKAGMETGDFRMNERLSAPRPTALSPDEALAELARRNRRVAPVH